MENKGLSKLFPVLFVTICSGLLYYPMFKIQVARYDYQMHLRAAYELLNDGVLKSSHFLYQLIIIFFQQLPGSDWTISGLLAVLVPAVITNLLIYWGGRRSGVSEGWSAFAAITLTIVSPLTLFFPWDQIIYMGYIGINTYHNPTIWLLKPFALGTVFLLLRIIREEQQPKVAEVVALAFLVVLSALAKPNFLIALLPALLILVLCDLKVLRHRAWVVALAVFLPGFAVLGWQYMLTYSMEQVGFYSGNSGIIFAPLKVMEHYSKWLLPKALLSIVFPLAVVIGYGKKALSNRGIRLAWLIFIIGATYGYLLAESGPRIYQANFFWSGQIGLFILFVNSLLFVLSQHNLPGEKYSRVQLVCLSVFALHLLNGIVFYGVEYLFPEKFLGWS